MTAFDSEMATMPLPLAPVPLRDKFTLEDRRMIIETHEAITKIAEMLSEVLPQMASNPMVKMLLKMQR